MYTVIYNKISSPIELEIWLNNQYKKGLELVATTGEYHIFKDRKRTETKTMPRKSSK